MGLDTWVRVRTNKDLHTESTGVCSGLFGVIPTEDGTQEIGYFRNWWLLTTLLLEHRLNEPDDNSSNNNIEIDISCLDEIEMTINELLSCEFDEDGDIIVNDDCDIDEETLSSARDCFDLYDKLLSAREMIEKIKELKKEDNNLKLYLSYWY